VFGWWQEYGTCLGIAFIALITWAAKPAPAARKAAMEDFILNVAGELPFLAYDAAAAGVNAELRWEAQHAGRTQPHIDAKIAAIAIARRLMLVTCNLKDFEGIAGLRLSNRFGQSAV
jgi:predicted nucleic acid-binding protein